MTRLNQAAWWSDAIQRWFPTHGVTRRSRPGSLAQRTFLMQRGGAELRPDPAPPLPSSLPSPARRVSPAPSPFSPEPRKSNSLRASSESSSSSSSSTSGIRGLLESWQKGRWQDGSRVRLWVCSPCASWPRENQPSPEQLERSRARLQPAAESPRIWYLCVQNTHQKDRREPGCPGLFLQLT